MSRALNAGGGTLDPVTQAYWDEYRYRKLFGLTAEQYDEEPSLRVRWMTEIDERVRAAERRAQDAANARAGR